MEKYLTARSEKSRAWELPVLALLILLIIASVSVTGDYLRENPGDLWVPLLLLALFIYPAYRIVRTRYYRWLARKIAGRLDQIPVQTVPLDDLDIELSEKDAQRKIRKLLDSFFLQNLRVDSKERQLLLLAENEAVVEQVGMEVVCPYCGAKNRIIRGRVSICEYCRQELVGK